MIEVDLGCVHGIAGPIELRPLSDGDDGFYCRLYTDAACMRWIGAVLDRETAMRSFMAARGGKGPCWRAIVVERASGQPIGLVAIEPVTSGTVEIGVILLRSAWGKGLARAALERVLKVLGQQSQARICMRVQAGNAPMLRLASALRFRFAGKAIPVVAGPADQPGWLLLEAAP